MLSRLQTRRIARLTCALLACMGLSLSAASAQIAPVMPGAPGTPANPPPATASITGIVTVIGGDPIAGAMVEARRAACGTNGGETVRATTGDDGRFTLEKMPEGSWCVGAAHPSGRFMPTEYQQRDYEGRGVTLPMKADQKTEITLYMIPTGGIAGRVFDVDGEPMARVRVQAMRVSYRDGERRLYAYNAIQTDDRGDFRFFWLPADRYFLAATVEDPDRPRSAISTPSPGQGGTRVDTFSPYIIRRNAPNGEIVEETYRTVYYGGGRDAANALPIDVRPGPTGEAISFSLAGARMRSYHVRGTVIYTAPPPAASNAASARGGSAAATPAAQQPAAQARPIFQIRIVPRDWSASVTIASASTDSDGKFDVSGVTPGSYDLYVTAQGVTARVPIAVGNSHVENLRVTPVAPYKIAGRVHIENPALLPATELRSLRVGFVNDPEIPGLPAPSTNVTTSPEGVLSVAIPQGRFRVFAQPLIGPSQLALPSVPRAFENVYVRSIRLGDTDVLAEGLSVTGAPRGDLDVVLGTAGSMAGTVTSEGRPVINATVVLIPDLYRNRLDLYRVARTDGSGKYQIKGAAPGAYKAFAWFDARDGQWHDPEFMRHFETRGELVHISEGVRSAADLPALTR